MMKPNFKGYMSKNKEALGTRTAKVGSYSFLLSVIVLAILVAVNVFVTYLPSTLTQFDISAAQLYSLTADSKAVASGLDKDVTIYWICQSGQEDTVIDKLLGVYDSLSDHLTVVKKDPDTYPTFAAQYTDEDVSNNSLVVECGDNYRYISYDSIYETDTSSYYETGSVSQSFDGEGEITNAIDYVTADELPQVYVISGHDEAELTDTMTDDFEKGNVELQDLSLLNIDEIPEDADCLLINAPASDYSEEEIGMLEDYMDNGGHIFVLSGPQDGTELTNLDSLLASYGVTVNEGIVVESDRDHYAFTYPYVLLPDLESSDITDPLIEDDSKVICSIAGGLTIGGTNSNYTVTSLMQTSDSAFSKIAGYSLTTYDKEDGDIDGPFSLAVSVQSNSGDGKLVWISSDVMLDDTYNSYSSGANTDFVMNALSWMVGKTDSISIRSKSLDFNYLTISASQANVIKICMIGVIPLAFLAFGLDETISRRKRK